MMTLDAVAKRAGISKTYLWELESDHAGDKRPSVDILSRIATALDVDLGRLVGMPALSPPVFQARATIGKGQIMQALREATIGNDHLDRDIGWWSIQDAIDLELAANAIRRELRLREESRERDGEGRAE
jgi:transcriptional regulator with XRE-family HTH domain